VRTQHRPNHFVDSRTLERYRRAMRIKDSMRMAAPVDDDEPEFPFDELRRTHHNRVTGTLKLRCS
jgi:hypothetical protein